MTTARHVRQTDVAPGMVRLLRVVGELFEVLACLERSGRPYWMLAAMMRCSLTWATLVTACRFERDMRHVMTQKRVPARRGSVKRSARDRAARGAYVVFARL